MTASISYINLSWAVVGIIDRDVHNSLQSMKRPDEPIETTIERYVIGYLAFWHIAYIDKEKMNRCDDEKVIELGRKKMEEYVTSHPEENGGIRHLTSTCSYFAEVLHRLPKSTSDWLRYPRPQ